MGSNIKGITIEIGGDTRKLQDSLKDVNSKAKDIQGELRQVERLLKLDPSNTELLAQKQKLLNDAVSNTKEKLETLKEAQRQVQEQFEKGEIGEAQYNAIQREVIATEQELSKLEDKLKQVNNKWDDTAKSFQDFGSKAEDVGKKLAPVSAIAAGASVGAAKMASDFADAMAKVSTIADTAEVPLDDLKNQIMDLSSQTGISANEIANNVYDAISAGQKTGDAVAFVEKSTRLAKAGFAEAGQSLDLLTTILNAYGLESEKAGEVSDMLIQVQNKGKVTVGELSAVMGKIIPTANSLGVGLDQVGAGYAILTSKGIKAAEATTYMNSMLNEMGKTGTTSDIKLRELTGKSFKELIESGTSVGDVLSTLNEYATESGLSLSDMFGSAEAAKAALTLLGDSSAGFNDMVSQMNDSLGATDEAFNKLQTPGEETRIAFNKLKNAAIELGDVVLPVVAKVAEGVGVVADKLLGMNDATKTIIMVILLLVAAIAPVLIVIGKMATGIGALIKLIGIISPALSALAPVIGFLASPIGLVIVAIVALIAIITTLWNKNEKFRDFIIGLWEAIRDGTIEIVTAIGSFLSESWTAISDAIRIILEVMSKIITDKFGFIWESIKLGFEAFRLLFEGDFAGFLEKLIQSALVWVTGWAEIGKDIVRGIWNGIKSMGDWIGKKISGFFTGIVDGAKDVLGIHSPSRVFADIIGKNMALGVGEGFTDQLQQVNDNISDGLDTTVDVARSKTYNSKATNYFNIKAYVRSDNDVKKLAKEIHQLQVGAERGLGIA